MPLRTDNLVISRIDFRIQEILRSWLQKKFPDHMYDYIALAGSVKDLFTAEKQLKISEKLHNVKYVTLIEHEDCGAYGNEEEVRAKQLYDLYKAKKEMLGLFPSLTIHLYYLHVSGIFEKIE